MIDRSAEAAARIPPYVGFAEARSLCLLYLGSLAVLYEIKLLARIETYRT